MRKIVAMAIVSLLVVTATFAGDKMKCEGTTEECVQKLAAELQNRGWLGVEFDKSETGAMAVKAVVAGSPAAAAGFEVGDVLVAIGDVAISTENSEAVSAAFQAMQPGDLIRYKVDRAGRERTLKARLARMPESIKAQWLDHYRQEHAEQMAAATK